MYVTHHEDRNAVVGNQNVGGFDVSVGDGWVVAMQHVYTGANTLKEAKDLQLWQSADVQRKPSRSRFLFAINYLKTVPEPNKCKARPYRLPCTACSSVPRAK